MTPQQLLQKIQHVQKAVSQYRADVHDRIVHDTNAAKTRITDTEQRIIASIRASLKS